MYNELPIKQIKARGWIKNFLQTQARGLTGEIGNVGEPFCKPTWENVGEESEKHTDNFLGGLNSKDDSWVPYEQTGYWIDGAIRAGYLADNEKLIDLAKKKIYPAVENPSEDGFMGPELLRDGLSWPFAVWYRALIAEYGATGNPKIIEALKNHFLRKPLTDAYKRDDYRIISVRNVADIETALWLYGQTKDARFLQMSKESYAEFNRLFSDDSNADVNSEMRDITVVGMLANRKVQRNHGVTYCEICKLSAIMYYYTGEEKYKEAAVNAFDKLYRDQMLIDGVASSTEYLNGNQDSWAAHETCVVSDQTWAIGYLYMITEDPKYGDWIEDAIYNAGLGSVDDDFKNNQYFSCPNQVVSNDKSNHAAFYRGNHWNAFSNKKLMGCCAGNVHRMVPNLVARSWMQDGDRVSAFIYTPSEVDLEINGINVKIEETTEYPFANTVKFVIHTQSPNEFTLVLRKPRWAVTANISINGEKYNGDFTSGLCNIKRIFNDNDEVVITFTDKIELIENARGVSVKKGALLYAFPVKEQEKICGLRQLENPDFPYYHLYAEGKWNYGLKVLKANEFTFINGAIGDEPWRKNENAMRIQVIAQEVKDWKINKVGAFRRRLKPRGKYEWVKQEAVFTPKVREVKADTPLGEEENLMLVPYCTTRLRIAIFPKIK